MTATVAVDIVDRATSIDDFLLSVYRAEENVRDLLFGKANGKSKPEKKSSGVLSNLRAGQLYRDLRYLAMIFDDPDPDPALIATDVRDAIARVEACARSTRALTQSWYAIDPIGVLISGARQRAAVGGEYITVAEAARRIGSTIHRLTYAIAYGHLTPFYNPFARSAQQGRRLLRASDVDSYAATQKDGPDE